MTLKQACGMHTWHTQDTIYHDTCLSVIFFKVPMWILVMPSTALCSKVSTIPAIALPTSPFSRIVRTRGCKAQWRKWCCWCWNGSFLTSIHRRGCVHANLESCVVTHLWAHSVCNQWILLFFQVFLFNYSDYSVRPCGQPRPSPWTFGRPGKYIGVQVWSLNWFLWWSSIMASGSNKVSLEQNMFQIWSELLSLCFCSLIRSLERPMCWPPTSHLLPGPWFPRWTCILGFQCGTAESGRGIWIWGKTN